MRFIFGLILLIFLGTVALFALQNMQVVPVTFATWTRSTPVAFLAVAAYLLGMVSGWTVVGFVRRSFNRVTAESRPRSE